MTPLRFRITSMPFGRGDRVALSSYTGSSKVGEDHAFLSDISREGTLGFVDACAMVLPTRLQ